MIIYLKLEIGLCFIIIKLIIQGHIIIKMINYKTVFVICLK